MVYKSKDTSEIIFNIQNIPRDNRYGSVNGSKEQDKMVSFIGRCQIFHTYPFQLFLKVYLNIIGKIPFNDDYFRFTEKPLCN